MPLSSRGTNMETKNGRSAKRERSTCGLRLFAVGCQLKEAMDSRDFGDFTEYQKQMSPGAFGTCLSSRRTDEDGGSEDCSAGDDVSVAKRARHLLVRWRT